MEENEQEELERIVIEFVPGLRGQQKSEVVSRVGGRHVRSIEPLNMEVVLARRSARAIEQLRNNPNVVSVELDQVVELEDIVPNDPEYYRQWGITKTRTNEAWSVSRGSRNTVIAILDTGVAPVPDLVNKLVPGRNIVANNNDATDVNGHGTMSAGVAGAETDNNLGVASYGWNCSIMPVKVMESSGNMSDLAAGIVWATDNGAHVISMSLSGPSGTTAVHNAVQYAANRNVSLVAAAGNQGDTVQRFPAAYPEVIAVAGARSTDVLYDWSNRGQWVDVAAPGQNRTSSLTSSNFLYGGTSSATPSVAGVLGLARTRGASAAQARTALQNGSVPHPDVAYGRVDAMRMMELLGFAGQPEPEPEPEPPTPEPEPEPEPEPPAPEPEPEPEPPAPEPEPEPEPEPGPTLQVTAQKNRGISSAVLRWEGLEGTLVQVLVDTRLEATVSNSGNWTHDTGRRGSFSSRYQVRDASGNSTPEVHVDF